jgi:fructose-1-phosphate kinase PfkB-like protein
VATASGLGWSPTCPGGPASWSRRCSTRRVTTPELSPADRDAWFAAFDADALGHAVVVASGSLPPGPGAAGLYHEVVRRAHAHGLRIVLDAARADLAAALPAGPDVVTPNLAEARAVLTGVDDGEAVEPDLPDLHRAAVAAAAGLRALGARAALVTAGRHGVAGDDGTGGFWIDAPELAEVNPVGAGDAFAAGLAVGLERGATLREAAMLAVATGSASVTTELAGRVDAELVRRLLADGRIVARDVTA